MTELKTSGTLGLGSFSFQLRTRLKMLMLSNYGMQLRAVREIASCAKSRYRRSAILAGFALVAACGGDDPIQIASVTVSPNTATVAIGATSQLAAATLDANGTVITGRAVTWTTSNASMATVSGGLVTGVAPGTVTITATSEGKTGTASITVLPPPVATVTITPAAPTVVETRTTQLTAVVKAADGSTLSGRTVTWSSGTVANATVNSSGVVTGLQVGTSVITATSEGKSATTTISVTVSPCNTSLAVAIVSGVTVNGVLAATDCELEDDHTFLDAYRFVITTKTTVDVLMRSTAFDAYIFIVSLPPSGLVIEAEDNNTGGGTDARLTGQIDPGTYYILANSFNPNTFGPYTLLFTSPVPAPGAINMFGAHSASAVQLERLSPAEARTFRGLVRGRR